MSSLFSFLHHSWGISIEYWLTGIFFVKTYSFKKKCLFIGIILEYEQGGNLKTKSIDLLDLKVE